MATEISWSSVQEILTRDLKKVSVCARWIPHALTDVQQQLRIFDAQNLLQQINGGIICN